MKKKIDYDSLITYWVIALMDIPLVILVLLIIYLPTVAAGNTNITSSIIFSNTIIFLISLELILASIGLLVLELKFR